MNRILQDKYVEDCHRALRKWNNIIRKAGIDYELTLLATSLQPKHGAICRLDLHHQRRIRNGCHPTELADRYSPTDDDREYLKSIMQQVREPGKYANWIAPLKTGINRRADFEYIRFV